MAEVFLAYADPVTAENGETYLARAVGRPTGHTWEGWIEFTPLTPGPAVRSGRETTQPNRTDLEYWATGLTAVFLEGSLRRALKPTVRRPAARVERAAYDEPAPPFADNDTGSGVESVLNPLSVYRKGEPLLRKQLAALSEWHLVNIVRDYDMSALPTDELNRMSETQLIELIVSATRERIDGLVRS